MNYWYPMRVLLDESVPRPLPRELTGHDVRTIRDMGWPGKKNGELLALMAEDGFEVLLTMDKNIRYQQNLAAFGVAVVVMVNSTNRLADLTPFIPGVEAALSTIQAGDVVEVSALPNAEADHVAILISCGIKVLQEAPAT